MFPQKRSACKKAWRAYCLAISDIIVLKVLLLTFLFTSQDIQIYVSKNKCGLFLFVQWLK